MVIVIPIIEGHGEQQAIERLLHRLAGHCGNGENIRVKPPIRIKSGSFLSDASYFQKYVALAMSKAAQEAEGHVLILLDCDDECPADLGPKLLDSAKAVRPGIGVSVALLLREYETAFLAAARSLRGVCGLPDDLEPPANPERIRDAKGWLSSQMPGRYDPIVHQLAFTSCIDIDEAKSTDSFARLCRVVEDFTAA